MCEAPRKVSAMDRGKSDRLNQLADRIFKKIYECSHNIIRMKS